MTTITLEQLKENMIEVRINELLEDHNVKSVSELDSLSSNIEFQESLDEFKEELNKCDTIKRVSQMFDDERFSKLGCSFNH